MIYKHLILFTFLTQAALKADITLSPDLNSIPAVSNTIQATKPIHIYSYLNNYKPFYYSIDTMIDIMERDRNLFKLKLYEKHLKDFYFILHNHVHASEDSGTNKISKIAGCPNAKALEGLCGTVLAKIADIHEESPFDYLYQGKIFKAACVDINSDNDESARKKIQAMWKNFDSELVCDSMAFNVPKGSIIKLAVIKTFVPFINDVLENWKVNLNKIDASDQKTVLDYISSEKQKVIGTPKESILQRYYDRFRSAGAKHKIELDALTQPLLNGYGYEQVGRPAEGLIPVMKGGKWGYVNEKYEMVIPLQFKTASYFLECGLAEVSNGTTSYFINRKGVKEKGPWD